MDKAKEFQDSVKKFELSESKVKALKENGFDSTQNCELLNSTMIQNILPKLWHWVRHFSYKKRWILCQLYLPLWSMF